MRLCLARKQSARRYGIFDCVLLFFFFFFFLFFSSSSSSSSTSSLLLSVKQLYLSINIRLDPGEIPFAEASNNARVRWSVHIFCNRFDASEINTALSLSFIKSAGELFGVLPHSNLDISADGDKISLLFG